MAKSLIICGPNSNPNPLYQLMENTDKELTVPKWVLIKPLKTPKITQNLSAQIVCPSSKVWDFDKKGFIGVRSPWASLIYVFLSITYI